MSRSLNNVATSDAYTDAATVFVAGGNEVSAAIYNASVLLQVSRSEVGTAPAWSDEYGPYTPQTLPSIPGANGIRFRSATAGTPAQILATVYLPSDLRVASGQQLSGVLSPGGGFSPGVSGVLDYAESSVDVNLTATTEATAQVLVTAGAAVVLDGLTPILVQWSAPFWTNGAGAARSISVYLYAALNGGAAASIGRMCRASSDGTTNPQTVAQGYRRYTPLAGSYVFSSRGTVNNATGTTTINAGAAGVGDDMPMFQRVSVDT